MEEFQYEDSHVGGAASGGRCAPYRQQRLADGNRTHEVALCSTFFVAAEEDLLLQIAGAQRGIV